MKLEAGEWVLSGLFLRLVWDRYALRLGTFEGYYEACSNQGKCYEEAAAVPLSHSGYAFPARSIRGNLGRL